MNQGNKAVVRKTSPEAVEHQVRFEPQRFDSLVFDKGDEVWLDRAYRCPCADEVTGNPLPSCKNCLGKAWIFANRIETRIAVQAIKADVKYENWSRTTSGMAKITSRAIDKLAFMDRITLRNVEGYYNEIVRTKMVDNEVVIYTNYPIIEIEDLMMFTNTETPLSYLEKDIDYTFEEFGTKITLIGGLSNLTEVTNFTIRYRHLQTYHIIDMNRDIRKVRTKDGCVSDEQLRNMPIMGFGRKAHYLFDNNKYKESLNLLENNR